MPFKSEKQRRYLWMHEPEIARRWAEKEKRRRSRRKKQSDAITRLSRAIHSKD